MNPAPGPNGAGLIQPLLILTYNKHQNIYLFIIFHSFSDGLEYSLIVFCTFMYRVVMSLCVCVCKELRVRKINVP